MTNITIITEQISVRALAAALPQGVRSLTVVADTATHPEAPRAPGYHSFRNPNRFAPTVRLELVVADTAVETVFDSLSFAYDAGFFADAEAWINTIDQTRTGEPALALSA